MSRVRVSQRALIRAPARTVYSLIADYRTGHPRIVPHRYFRGLEVERGGVGAGTVIRFDVLVPGSRRTVRAEISEPVPGEVLVETDLATGARTTFAVTPRDEGRESEVTITTEWETKGLRGWVEKMTAPSLFRRIYAEELAQLEAVAAATGGRSNSTPAGA